MLIKIEDHRNTSIQKNICYYVNVVTSVFTGQKYKEILDIIRGGRASDYRIFD